MLEAGDDGLSMNTFEEGQTYQLTRPAAEPAPSAGTQYSTTR
jgi:hypothetical protein